MGWCKQAAIDRGGVPGTTTLDAKRIRDLEAENRELKRANEMLLAASRSSRFIAQLAAFERSLASVYEQADQQARQLGASLTGAAFDDHQAVRARWSRGAADMHTALVTMRSTAQTALENYCAAASTNSSM